MQANSDLYREFLDVLDNQPLEAVRLLDAPGRASPGPSSANCGGRPWCNDRAKAVVQTSL